MKMSIDNASFFIFSQHWTKSGPNFVPKTTSTLLFLADFQCNMLGDSININKLCCNCVVLKKLCQTSKTAIFGQNLHKKEVSMDHTQLSETFYFIKILYILADVWILFCFVWNFLSKKGHFQLLLRVLLLLLFSLMQRSLINMMLLELCLHEF